jgi:protein SCO1/2
MHRRPPITSAIATALLALAALAGCSSSTSGGGAVETTGASAANVPSATGYDGALLPASLRPREFALTDQYGRRVSLTDFKGKVVILTFLYTTSKTTAPLIAQQIRGALDELESEPPHTPQGSNSSPTASRNSSPTASRPTASRPGRRSIPALAISLAPIADTPTHVQMFLRAASLTGRMEYLTGATAQLRPVWHAYAAVPASAGAVAYERSAFVLLLDKRGAPQVEFPVEELTPEALAHDIRRLRQE